MQIVEVEINKIVPYEKNPRQHGEQQINRIASSIAEFGFNQPVVIDENSIVLVGHGRLAAAKKIGLKSIPTLRLVGLSEAQKKAYRIIDNKLQNDSTWQIEDLGMELQSLEEFGFDLDLYGLDDLKVETDTDIIDDDFEPSETRKTSIVLGDVIELGVHRVVCGDSRVVFPTLAIDMILTDPPYGVRYVGKTKDALTIASDDLKEDELREMWHQCLDAALSKTRAGAAIYVSVPPGPIHHVFSLALRERDILRQSLVWLKNNIVLGHSDYHYRHESILYGWKPGAAHYITADRTKTSILEHKKPQRSAEHPTMKPLSLWGELIKNSSKEGWLIYDPFLGSGTTLIACEQLGRVCHGVELDPIYCQVIIDRYRKYCLSNNKEPVVKINDTII